jgi:hypothetical protein
MVKSVMPIHLKEYLKICKKRFNIVVYLLKTRTVKPAETTVSE